MRFDLDDDELVDASSRQRACGPLVRRPIMCLQHGVRLMGTIDDVELGAVTGRRYYRVRFTDGDLQHMDEITAARHALPDSIPLAAWKAYHPSAFVDGGWLASSRALTATSRR